MSNDRLRAIIEAVPSHDIGGYEWECYSCHSHYLRSDEGAVQVCRTCERVIESPSSPGQFSGSFFEDGTPTVCDDLVSRADVLRALGLTAQ